MNAQFSGAWGDQRSDQVLCLSTIPVFVCENEQILNQYDQQKNILEPACFPCEDMKFANVIIRLCRLGNLH